ncbi:RHS repeat domain-containing protein [Pseudomonas syringae group genomosp. 3]|uniref:RHS repeat domain-containing protein n=2 Tax=Pseudomonas syringae group genomosp. 3 TaxID=251701 RepID=UPI00398B2421
MLSIQRKQTDTGRKLGVTAEKLEFTYDLLGRLVKETTPQGALTYDYDPLSNLTTLTLPTGQHLNHLYYGSGHLHQLNLDGQLISDMERDDLHREIYRTQGKLTSCFGYDSMGRKAWQYATTLPAEKLSQIQNPLIKPERYVEHAYNSIHRRYEYDPAGELSRTLDKLRGETRYEYEANGQLLARNNGLIVDGEEFRYDAAANRLNFNTSRFDHVKDNRLKQWRNHEYKYDAWGNLIEKAVGIVRWQTFTYDCENRLVKTETMADTQVESTSSYQYDSLGRRVGKQSEIKGQSDQKRFLWQGLRMLREDSPGQSSLYLYEPGSYAPLARVDQKEYEANGQLLARNNGLIVDGEEFRYDAAANRLNFNTSRFDHVKDNRLKQWRNHEYKYDAWGNLIEKAVGIVRWQTFTYDCENRLVKTETMADTQVESTSSYQYDSLGRRVAKQSEIKGQTDHKRFLWQGLRMLREESPGQSSLYLYEPGRQSTGRGGC